MSACARDLAPGTYRVAPGGAAESLPALAANPAIRTLFGEPVGLDTAGGFTVWRTGTVLAVLVGVWAALAATRLTRGEEDAGRVGPAARRAAAPGSVVARASACWSLPLAVGVPAGSTVLLLAGTAAGRRGRARRPESRWSACSSPRRAGRSCGRPALGVRRGRRGAARRPAGPDGRSTVSRALALAAWLTPFGLLDLSRPYAGDRALPLLVLVVAAVA